MKNLSIAQSYMLCALNEKGKFPLSASTVPACLVAGSLADFLLEQKVSITEKKIKTAAPLGGELSCLQSIYDFIAEKEPIKIEKLAQEYCFTFSDKRINELTDAIGEALIERGCVTSEPGGLFRSRAVFIPNKDAVDAVVQHIRADFLEDGILSDEMVALACLLEKSGMLKRYFSHYEKDALKARLKEIRASASNKVICELLDSVDAMLTAVIVAAST